MGKRDSHFLYSAGCGGAVVPKFNLNPIVSLSILLLKLSPITVALFVFSKVAAREIMGKDKPLLSTVIVHLCLLALALPLLERQNLISASIALPMLAILSLLLNCFGYLSLEFGYSSS